MAAYFVFDGSLVSQNFTSLTAAVFGFPLVSVAYGFMVIAAISPNCPLSRWRFWPAEKLATLSYCIYLSHKMINHAAHTAVKYVVEPNRYLIFPVCLTGAVVCGLILHLLVEKPFLVLRDHLKN